MQETRRNLLKFCGQAVLGASALPLPFGKALAEEAGAEPHYFIEIIFIGGWDVSYLFDARPLAMRAAGKLQNYSKAEPER